jgi:formamidopyrimidine-DNA glycosylase
MPELPEVETMRRGIAGVAGCRIEGVDAPRTSLHPIQIAPALPVLRRRLVGRRIEAVDRLGKRVVLVLDSGQRLIIEPRMTGRVLLEDPPNRSHLRLVLRLSGGSQRQLLFWDVRGLGVIRLLTADELLAQLGPQKLGPDALEISADELRRRLAASRRPIKVALLDQQVLAGIGNLYASEILHRAGLHPQLGCRRLRRGDWAALTDSVREVLQEAIDAQGSTLSDGTYRNARNQAGGYQQRHRVYQRDGKPCLECGRGEVQRIVQAQRSTFFCPICQPRRRRSGESTQPPVK